MSEKQQHKINIGRDKLSKEAVRKKQNFGKILNNHKSITKPPIYKNRKFYLVLFLVLLITYLIYLAENPSA